jgi:energy-coupling factor transporter transmembrane protein EcfT
MFSCMDKKYKIKFVYLIVLFIFFLNKNKIYIYIYIYIYILFQLSLYFFYLNYFLSFYLRTIKKKLLKITLQLFSFKGKALEN